MEITSLEGISFHALYLAFAEAFKDYDIQLTEKELLAMLRRRGFVPALSFGAFADNKLIAFTFNGVGIYNQVNTAYDTGTGTIAEYRGQGLATSLFDYAIPHLKKAGISNYLLEVLTHNEQAVSIYSKMQFAISRTFYYYFQTPDKLRFSKKLLPKGYTMQKISISQIDEGSGWMDFLPSWQNSLASIQRSVDAFSAVGAYYGAELIGYGILEPASGDLTQIVVHPSHRRKGIASQLLQQCLKFNRHAAMKVINIPTDCISMTGFLESHGIDAGGRQYEMIRQL